MMKRILVTISIILVTILGLESLSSPKAVKKDGAAPGYTGSPGDSLKNCTACHGGFAVPVDDWVTSNIPEDGYVPGQTYTITATNKEVGATRFGFEVSPQDLAGNLMGMLKVTDSLTTKLVGDDKYITYTAEGIESIDSLAWSFNWVAPASGSGEVVFYGGFNSNYEGHKGGDQTYLSTLSVHEKGTASVSMRVKHKKDISIFPNPLVDKVNLSFSLDKNETVQVDIYDLKGTFLFALYKQVLATGSQNLQFSLADKLTPGAYFAKISIGKKGYNEKIVVK